MRLNIYYEEKRYSSKTIVIIHIHAHTHKRTHTHTHTHTHTNGDTADIKP